MAEFFAEGNVEKAALSYQFSAVSSNPCGTRDRGAPSLRELAQEPALSEAEGVGFHGRPPLGFRQFYGTYPAPRNTFPGNAPVIFPSSITGTPLTSTYCMPSDKRLGSS
jgi:hypothetical protein